MAGAASVLVVGLLSVPAAVATPTSVPDPDQAVCHPWDGMSVPSNDAIQGMDGTSGSDIWGAMNASVAPHPPNIIHWDGRAWTLSPITAADGDFFAVDAISETDAWAVGTLSSYQKTLAVHWDGTVWSSVPTPSPEGSYDILQGVSGTSSSDVWAVGITGLTTGLVIHWDGVQWSVVDHPEYSGGAVYRSVVALGPDDAWAVGGDPSTSGPAFMQHWNGIAWSDVPLPDLPNDANLSAVAASGPNDVWAVGTTDSGAILIYRWDGISLRRVDRVPWSHGVVLSSVSVLRPDDVWVAGTKLVAGPPETAHWNGSRWAGASLATKENGFLNAIRAFSHDDVWTGGDATSRGPGVAAHFQGCP